MWNDGTNIVVISLLPSKYANCTTNMISRILSINLICHFHSYIARPYSITDDEHVGNIKGLVQKLLNSKYNATQFDLQGSVQFQEPS